MINSRLRLWLRGEQAFGLDSLPVRLPERRPVAAPAPPVSRPAVRSGTPPTIPPPVRTPAAPAAQPVRPAVQSIVDTFAAPNAAPFDGPIMPHNEKVKILAELNEKVKVCRKCELCGQRTNTVFGEGDPDAQLMFIGEGPGEQEDLSGRPFVGRAGQKLDEMIAAMGLKRGQVYIANIVKCRPPGNRQPIPPEAAACIGYLHRQIEVIRPKVIVTLGLTAAKYLLQVNQSMGSLRGRWQTWRGIKVMPTFHPSYILRVYTVETRKAVWDDLQRAMAELGLKRGK